MEVVDIVIMLRSSKDEIRYNKNVEYLEGIFVYDNFIKILRNRFENADGDMVEEATIYPMENIEYYTYIEVEKCSI